MEEQTEKSEGYGKRPMWQWIVIYLVVGGLIYGLIYYFFLSKKGGYTNDSQTQATPTQVADTSAPEAVLVIIKTEATKGDYLADPAGMTLYIFDKDAPGVSNCDGDCAITWPPYMALAAPAQLPTDMTVVKRSDGSSQYAWKGLPLYYYVKDKQVGDVTGDGVGGVWHLTK